MREGHIQGICAIDRPDFALMHDLGVRYVRLGVGFPFADAHCAALRPEFDASLRKIEQYAEAGFSVMATSLCPGSFRYNPETKQNGWVRWIPEWAGSHEADRYYEVIDRACEKMGQATRGMVNLWQISNEPDNEIFRGTMTDEQMNRFLLLSAAAIKRANPAARTGVNIAVLTEGARRMLTSIYGCENSPLDYIGIDGYFGSWEAGGPGKWGPYIDAVHAITGRPVIINEWGYSSLQSGPITDDPQRLKRYSQDICKTKAWTHVWQTAHSPEEQAEFMRQCIRIFADHPHCIGNFIFRWNDTETCWQCGQPECPAETAWGIVDVHNRPKPSFHALKQEIAHLFGPRSKATS